MLLEIAQEVRDQIAAQPGLYKGPVAGSSLQNGVSCTCVGIALEEESFKRGLDPNDVQVAFLETNGIDYKVGWEPTAVYNWNDVPERTLDEAVAALDKLVDYLRTTEGL